MKEKNQPGKWYILAVGAAIQILTGIPAAWGVFQRPVMEQYGLEESQAGLAFSLLIGAFGIGCVIGGYLQDRKGPRVAGLWGDRPLVRRIFCRRLAGREGARAVLPGVQHSRRIGVCLPLPGGDELRPEMVSQPEGPCHRNHRRGGGIQRGFSLPLCPVGEWPVGSARRLSGAGEPYAAGLRGREPSFEKSAPCQTGAPVPGEKVQAADL